MSGPSRQRGRPPPKRGGGNHEEGPKGHLATVKLALDLELKSRAQSRNLHLPFLAVGCDASSLADTCTLLNACLKPGVPCSRTARRGLGFSCGDMRFPETPPQQWHTRSVVTDYRTSIGSQHLLELTLILCFFVCSRVIRLRFHHPVFHCGTDASEARVVLGTGGLSTGTLLISSTAPNLFRPFSGPR